MTSTLPRDFLLGLNFPWVTCGHDFGPRPPPWSDGCRRDWSALGQEFARLAADGLRVLRWWILAGGVNYPLGVLPSIVGTENALHFPGADLRLPPAFLTDFSSLLKVAEDAGIQILPSLLSFEFFLPPRGLGQGVYSRGRSALVFGDGRGGERAALSRFLDVTLECLLEVSEAHRGAIYAWEVVNEPDWLAGLKPDSDGWAALNATEILPRAIRKRLNRGRAASKLSHLIEEAVLRITRRGFLSTVGFVRASPTWLTTSARATLCRTSASGSYLHQIHHYPRPGGPGESIARDLMPAAATAMCRPCIVGELPTAAGSRWPDPELERDPSLAAKVALCAQRGYAGALLWSLRAEDAHSDFGDLERRRLVLRIDDGI